MSAPRPCEHCGTMLVEEWSVPPGRTYPSSWEREPNGNRHTDFRCRDVLRAQLAERTRQRDEAIERALIAIDGLQWSDEGKAAARAALEKLRHE